MKEGDRITVTVPEPEQPDLIPENIPLDILYEDEDVLVINKPKNMVVHPAPGHMSGTLVNAVMYHCGDQLSGIGGVMRPGIVHRIDRNTTGSLIICKNDLAHQSIAAQLKDHSITRKYRAICYGILKEDDLVIDRPIGRDRDRKRMTVTEGGKRAVTHVHVLQRGNDLTEVECVLETGRTHQIRVHLSSIGHPVLGDEAYAGGRKIPSRMREIPIEGQCLHAMILGFVHPRTGEYVETAAPLPEYYQRIQKVL